MATPDAKSKNQTEQLLAEPEIQRLWSEIERVIVAGTRERTPARAGRGGPRRDPLGQMAAHPARGGVRLLGRPQRQGPDVQGGLVSMWETTRRN